MLVFARKSRTNHTGSTIGSQRDHFPYINVPSDPWLLRMLLYWDRLNAIVPMDYQWNPDRFEPRMHDMVAAGLV